MKTRKRMAIFVILGSLVIIVSVFAGQYKVKTENGVTIVTNGKKPDQPKGALTKLILEEIYTVGGGDAPDESFAEISALDVLKDGEDKDEMLGLIPNVSGVNVRDMIQFPEEFPPFGNFVLADEGRLLVRTYEKGRAKKEYYWDVFDAEGRYIAKVPIVHEIRLWRDGKAYFIVEDEDGYKTLKCCRARWAK